LPVVKEALNAIETDPVRRRTVRPNGEGELAGKGVEASHVVEVVVR
jgi:hypothetical protein